MMLLLGCLIGCVCTSIVWYCLRPSAIGTIFVVDGDSMYVELDDENSLDKMKRKTCVLLRVRQKHTQN